MRFGNILFERILLISEWFLMIRFKMKLSRFKFFEIMMIKGLPFDMKRFLSSLSINSLIMLVFIFIEGREHLSI